MQHTDKAIAEFDPDFFRYSERFYYDPANGFLFWKHTGNKNWDNKYAGKMAGCLHTDKGCGKCYYIVNVKGLCTTKKQHRIIFLLMTGRWPKHIDHINGNGADNRWCNLREVSRAENSRNYARRFDNKSGVPGIYIRAGRYRVIVKEEGRAVGLGTFDHLFEAACVKKSHEARNGFHVNHGRSSGIFDRAAIEAAGVTVRG